MDLCATCRQPLGEDGLCAACLIGGAIEATAATAQSPATEALATADVAEDLAFDSFGLYTVLRVLGEGGMGAVYLAEQSKPIRRKVALKVIKPGLDSRSILSRFNYERQTLALMDHPNIARVYDASATAKGPAILRDGVHRRRAHHGLLRPAPIQHQAAAGAVYSGLSCGPARAQ